MHIYNLWQMQDFKNASTMDHLQRRRKGWKNSESVLPQLTHFFLTLYVNHNELVMRLLEGEMAKCLRGESIHIRHKSRIGVVLYVASVNEMLHPIEGTSLASG